MGIAAAGTPAQGRRGVGERAARGLLVAVLALVAFLPVPAEALSPLNRELVWGIYPECATDGVDRDGRPCFGSLDGWCAWAHNQQGRRYCNIFRYDNAPFYNAGYCQYRFETEAPSVCREELPWPRQSPASGWAKPCPQGYAAVFNGSEFVCELTAARLAEANNGPPCPSCGNPINPANGNKYLAETDYRGSGRMPLEFTRAYNARGLKDKDRSAGVLWRHSYERSVSFAYGVGAKSAKVYRPDGRGVWFRQVNGAWVGDADLTERLEWTSEPGGFPASWRYVNERDETEEYDRAGRLVAIVDRAGLRTTLAYSLQGALASVTDPQGRRLAFTYDAAGRIASLRGPDNETFGYAYDALGNLASVTRPDGSVRAYHYENGAFPHALTGITDENGQRHSTYGYDAQGNAVTTERAGGADRWALAYNADGSAAVTDPRNVTRTYAFVSPFTKTKSSGISGSPCDHCGAGPTTTYDANGFVASRTDWNGNLTTYVHDARGLETARTEAAGTPQARTITTTWHPTFRLPTQIVEPGRTTDITYDSFGNVLTHTVSAAGRSRTWTTTYTYSASVPGLIEQMTVDGPRTDVPDVTTYEYYAADGAGSPPAWRKGDLYRVTNALGHVTQINAYNAHGQPTEIVDPNGLTTTLAYDSRRRLTSRDVGAETTTYAYDAAGQLVGVTLPDGSSLAYTYDAAHRLTALQDTLGHRIAYTLDAMGNRTREDVYDPSSALAQTRSRVFSPLNRLAQDIGGTHPAAQVTQYAYDAQGNLTSVTDPLNRVTSNGYDALNRLVTVTDPASGVTAFGYTALDQLASVTDPRSLTTSYTRNGLDELTQQLSPDTGATSNTYDAAGNVLTSTDARGITATYTYDALNRVSSVAYPDQTLTYTYDQGANGKGRLTGISDSTGSTTFAYDPQGRVTAQTRVIAGATYVTGYQYDSAGRLIGMTYPSGRTLAYTLDALGRIAHIDTSGGGVTEPVVTSVTYHPFGPVKSFLYGNAGTYARAFDLDGRVTQHTQGVKVRALTWDAVSRVSQIADAGAPATATTYGYDSLDRLTQAITPATTYGYGYDPVGNRLTRNAGASNTTYTYGATSNRLTAIGAQAVTHDAAGNRLNDGARSFTYDARGRMVGSTTSIGAAAYQVNALGERVRKTSALGDTVFHYDRDGRLIAETDATGTVKREVVWLGDLPVGVIAAAGTAPQEAVIDNGSASFSVTGEWPISTVVAGYEGTNYQYHAPNGDPPGGIVVDNGGAGFSVTGDWPASTVVSGYQGANYQHHVPNGDPPGGVTVDNTDAGASALGAWTTSTSTGGYLGANYAAHAPGSGAEPFTWSLAVPAAGSYKVYARWTATTNRATNATYTVAHAGGTTPVSVNQQVNGGQWQLLGTYTLNAGTATVTLSDAANGYVIADAVKLIDANAAPNTASWTASLPQAGDYQVYARWTSHPNRATDAKYTITHAGGTTEMTVNQQANPGQWNLLGTFAFGASATVALTDQANGYVIADAVKFVPANAPPNTAAWAVPAGQYEVFARWTAHPNRATDAKYTVHHAGGATPITVNQQANGGQWNSLGTYTFTAGGAIKLTDRANGYVIADAIRVVPTPGQGGTGGTPALYYVYPDHLGTPRVIANAANQPVWRWDNVEPFGDTPPQENPSGLGAFEFPLRFPGQYQDRETGLAYNYFRDYDAAVGRYVQSDPVGLAGGINTYAYAYANPLSYIDPNGEFVHIGFGIIVGGLAGFIAASNDPCASTFDLVAAALVGAAVGGATAAVPIGGALISAAVRGGLAGFSGNSAGQILTSGSENYDVREALVQGGIGAVSGAYANSVGLGYAVNAVRSGSTATEAVASSYVAGTILGVSTSASLNLFAPIDLGGMNPQGAASNQCNCQR